MVPLLVLLLSSALVVNAQQPTNEILLNEWESKLASMELLVREQIHNLRAQNDQLTVEVQELKAQTRVYDNENVSLRKKVEQLVSTQGESKAISNEDKASIPNNCAALSQIGYRNSGLYMVQAATNKIHTVYCEINNLNGAILNETVVGYNDIKSTQVYFHVQRNTVYSTVKTTIPYNVQRLNTGNAFNLNTGIFSAPKAGRYFFTLSGISQTASTRVYLYVKSGVTQTDIASSFSIDKFDTYALQSTLDLKAGDEVTSYLGEGSVGDGGYANMHFTGLLLEEDLVLG